MNGSRVPRLATMSDDPRLDPNTEPARIRAFFVQPEWARRGLARTLYAECERAAREAGFARFELMATPRLSVGALRANAALALRSCGQAANSLQRQRPACPIYLTRESW